MMSNDIRNTITREEYLEFKNDVNSRFDDVNRRLDNLDDKMSKLQNWMIGTSLSVVTIVLAAMGTYGTLVFVAFNSVR